MRLFIVDVDLLSDAKDGPDFAHTLGWTYYPEGLQEFPLSPSVWPTTKTERFALARQHLEHVLDIKPDYDAPNVRKQLARLES